MANNYLTASMFFPLDSATQITEAEEILEKYVAEFDEDEEPTGMDVEFEEKGLWIYGEEYFNVDFAAEYIHRLQNHFNIAEPFIFSWAEYCSKLRVDEFGGGSCVVQKDIEPYFVLPWQIANEYALGLTSKEEKPIIPSSKVVVPEAILLDKINDWLHDSDADDLARVAGEIFGGECYAVIGKVEYGYNFEFYPNENYYGAFNSTIKD